MDDRIERRAPWMPWAVTSVLMVAVAIVAYLLGTHGAESVVVDGDAPVRVRHAYMWFPGLWLFFPFMWIFVLRLLWWGPRHYYRPWRYHRYYAGSYADDRDEWEEWHRREHERMDGTRGRGSSGPGSGQGPVT